MTNLGIALKHFIWSVEDSGASLPTQEDRAAKVQAEIVRLIAEQLRREFTARGL